MSQLETDCSCVIINLISSASHQPTKWIKATLSYIKQLFLSKTERDYLLARDQANHDYVCVKSRLHKKLKVFVDQELPLLLEKGYLSDIAEFRNIAENCKIMGDSLVRIPLETSGGLLETSNVEGEEDKKVVGRVGVEPTTPAMSRRYPNQARPPARYTMKKFAAQIYVVDRL